MDNLDPRVVLECRADCHACIHACSSTETAGYFYCGLGSLEFIRDVKCDDTSGS